eukprot:188270-Pyramimonas_sp.AAC.1
MRTSAQLAPHQGGQGLVCLPVGCHGGWPSQEPAKMATVAQLAAPKEGEVALRAAVSRRSAV